jgi:sterol desaturase/sphingolipid hydroxylase (fatty acid hydroxylase superfamily)
MSTKPPNPGDSIKSTWRRQDKKNWAWQHWLIEVLNVHHTNINQSIPAFPKTEKVPYVRQWSHQLWVSFYAISSLLVHQALLEITGHREPSRWIVGAYYFLSFQVILMIQVRILRRFSHTYGFLDGDEHERNEVPDVGVSRAVASLIKTLGSRTAMTILLTYDPSQSPFDVMARPSWWAWLIVKISAYGVVLDFWFYWYHRFMHEVPFLWKFHRKHHLIKHPIPLLSAYADDEQEFFDMVGIPLMTYLTLSVVGCRLGFYDWWVCHLFIVYVETWGHSGLRLYTNPPSPIDWLLLRLDFDLTIEDHDLHHRKGWRKSHNYGKQTRMWDRIFGTTTERVEVVKNNIDTEHGVRMPLY